VRSVAGDNGDDRAVLLLRRDPAGVMTHPPAARHESRSLLGAGPLDRTAAVPVTARGLGNL
jgi:hypothetical protein